MECTQVQMQQHNDAVIVDEEKKVADFIHVALLDILMANKIVTNDIDALLGDNTWYIGGSFVAYAHASVLKGFTTFRDAWEGMENHPNDIDVYSKNSLRFRQTHLSTIMGVNSKMSCNSDDYTNYLLRLSMDVVTIYFETFTSILNGYDCTMTMLGYQPNTRTLYSTQEYSEGLMKNTFYVIKSSTIERLEKIQKRCKSWYNDAELIINVGCHSGGYGALSSSGSNATIDCKAPKMDERFRGGVIHGNCWFGSRCCVSCGVVHSESFIQQVYFHCYMCTECKKNVENVIQSHVHDQNIEAFKGKSVLVVGGRKNFGKSIVEYLSTLQLSKLYVTSRHRQLITIEDIYSNRHRVRFDLDDSRTFTNLPINDIDVIIFNAWPTVEGNIHNWTHTLNQWPHDTYVERCHTVEGYAMFLRYLIENKPVNKTIWYISMDADESRFEGKLMHGRHLALNASKCAQKQITFSMGEILAGNKIYTMFYDPGWLSIDVKHKDIEKEFKNTLTIANKPYTNQHEELMGGLKRMLQNAVDSVYNNMTLSSTLMIHDASEWFKSESNLLDMNPNTAPYNIMYPKLNRMSSYYNLLLKYKM